MYLQDAILRMKEAHVPPYVCSVDRGIVVACIYGCGVNFPGQRICFLLNSLDGSDSG